MGAIDSSL